MWAAARSQWCVVSHPRQRPSSLLYGAARDWEERSSQWSGAVSDDAELLHGLVRLPCSWFPESLSHGWSARLSSLSLLDRDPVSDGAH
eukprot:14147472-Heterocapsa_arctica.AAC.1